MVVRNVNNCTSKKRIFPQGKQSLLNHSIRFHGYVFCQLIDHLFNFIVFQSYVRPKNVADQTEEEKIAEKRFSAALAYKTEAHRRQFSMQTCEAFDALVDSGVAVEMKSDASVSGQKVQENNRVEMTLSAMIWDGSSSQTQLFSEGTLKFTLGKSQVTAGLEEAVLRLHVNDEADIICAPLMAYGDAGQPPIVPPDAHIVYTVKIVTAVADEVECNKPAEGDPLLFNTGISQRVHSSAANSALGQKSKAVVLVTD